LLAKMEKHVEAAVPLGADPVAIVSERLLMARLGGSPEEVLRWADELAELAGPEDSSSHADLVLARFEALMNMDRRGDAFALSGEMERLRPLVSADERLTLDSALLLNALYRADNTASGDAASFVTGVRGLVEQGAIPRRHAVIVLRNMAGQVSQFDRFGDALTLALGAYEADSPEDPVMPTTMIALWIAELGAKVGNAQVARQYLGEATRWSEGAISASPGTTDDRVALRVELLFAQGRTLHLLAELRRRP
jgi:hypothetical protein